MYDISAPQIKAARALLDWSQEDLAVKANLSIGTIRTMELGFIPKDTTLQKIRKTIDGAGIEMTEDGVRRRPDEIKVFRGHDSCDKFFSSVEKISSSYNGDVLALVLAEELWLQPSGSTNQSNLKRLESLRGVTGVKCLLSDNIKLPIQPSAVQLQYLPNSGLVVLPSCAMIYGNRYSIMWTKGRTDFVIAEFDIPTVGLSYRKDFQSLWEKASPLKAKPSQSKPNKRN
jgi:transcriptional regulator with XRE-family HTH domain